MNKSVNRKIERFKKISKEFGICKSIPVAFYNFTNNDDKYIEHVLSILKKSLEQDAKKIKTGISTSQNEKPIAWSLWWQGAENLPPILKVCLESQKKYIESAGVDYRFVDDSNINDYIEIPLVIREKVKKGIISFTHYSDYVRIALIEKYGGMWIDITLLLTQMIDVSIFDKEFYSFNLDHSIQPPAGIGQKITICKWAGFMLGSSYLHHPLFEYIRSSLERYWTEHDCDIDYFLLNSIIRVAYDSNNDVKRLIDSIPVNNSNLYKLSPIINEIWDERQWETLTRNNTFFKLTQKKPVIESKDGKETFYKRIFNLYLVGDIDEHN